MSDFILERGRGGFLTLSSLSCDLSDILISYSGNKYLIKYQGENIIFASLGGKIKFVKEKNSFSIKDHEKNVLLRNVVDSDEKILFSIESNVYFDFYSHLLNDRIIRGQDNEIELMIRCNYYNIFGSQRFKIFGEVCGDDFFKILSVVTYLWLEFEYDRI